MRLGQHQEKFMADIAVLIIKAGELGYKCRGRELQRTVEQQKIHVANGASKTMNSMHLNCCAMDIYFFKDGELVYPMELGKYWESLDPLNRYGGNFDRDWTRPDNFKDAPHFQRDAR